MSSIGYRSFRLAALIALVLWSAMFGARAGENLAEPPVFASKNGVLDLLLIAEAAPITTLSPFAPTGWVYQFCLRPRDGANACPAGTPDRNLYGGTRLQLEQGDVLKIRLVNRLPPVADSKHAAEPGDSFLALNPTNIHTHGMLVSPHFPTRDNPTYGDNVFVLTLNPANGPPAADAHIHGDVRIGFTDYEIAIPRNHPSGLFWLHPHVHGVALNQVSAGLAGIITVGDIADYVCGDAACTHRIEGLTVRHILLKDTQILADSTLQDQEDPMFCDPAGAPGAPDRQGSCAGQDNTASGGGNYSGGKWFFTLNGQPYPTIPVASSKGEVWRITSTSGSASYNLRLWNPAQQRNMIVQVLAVDGVAVQPDQASSTQEMIEIGGTKMNPVPCPGISPPANGAVGAPLCVDRLLMMPSSRVELWVAYRDRHDRLARPEPGAGAIFRTEGFQTGPTGDSWPAVDLARVEFRGAGPSAGDPETLAVAGQALTLRDPTDLAADLRTANAAIGADASCKPLAQGHARRIFFNVPADNPNGFGLGYEEVDQTGKPVPGTFMDITPFDPDKPTICLPLGRGNTPVRERWELVNLAGEDHNFHIHQTKFRALTKDEVDGAVLPGSGRGSAILHDNVPLQHADGTCNSVDDWRNGVCTAHPVTVEIPFTVAGDFVYHCHILEHEDGGMMARIRVRPTL